MDAKLHALDIAILAGYCLAVVGMGLYYTRKCRTAEEFMVAGRAIPAWAAGLAIMSTHASSISYIATPGKAYDTNWHPLIFSLAICASIGVISWGTFARDLPTAWKWAEPSFEPILVGVFGTAALMIVALLLGRGNRRAASLTRTACGREGV